MKRSTTATKKVLKATKPISEKRWREEREFQARLKESSRRLTISERFLKQGRALGMEYTVVLEPNEGSGYRGRTLELPYVVGFGKSVDACIADLRDALAVAVGGMLANDMTPPMPSTANMRDDQVNIKLTRREKAFLTEAARREGFRSVADFMRSLAMRRVR